MLLDAHVAYFITLLNEEIIEHMYRATSGPVWRHNDVSAAKKQKAAVR
jgi:hypothetical protein